MAGNPENVKGGIMLTETPGLGASVREPSDFFLALKRRVMIVSLVSSSACGFSSYALALLQETALCLVPGTWRKVTPRMARQGGAHLTAWIPNCTLVLLFCEVKARVRNSKGAYNLHFGLIIYKIFCSGLR